jgi:hypothetical protein
MGLSRKELRKILIHPVGYLTMLPGSKARQQTTIAFRILPHLL